VGKIKFTEYIFKKMVIILFLLLSSCSLPGSWNGGTCNPSYDPNNHSGAVVSESLMNTLKTVKTTVINAAQTLFTNMTIGGSTLSSIVNNLLILYIIFLGIQYMFGMIETPQMEFVIRIIKIAVVLALISPGSWEFFNTYLFSIFINGGSDLIVYVTGNDTGNPLSFIDQILQFLIFDPNTLVKIMAISYATIEFGPIYFIIILVGMCQILIGAIGRTLIAYCMSYIYIALLLTLAPIFIIFILFETTYGFFEAWLKNLLRSTFEPVLLIAGMVFLTDIMIFVMNKILNFGVCFKCAFQPSIGGLPIPCINGIMMTNIDHLGSSIVSSIFTMFGEVMLFLIIASLMGKYADLASDISMSIFGSSNSKASAIGGSAAATHGAGQSALSTVGMDDKSKAKRAQQKALKQDYDKTHR
jgi:type IV secretion system protein VirB6